MSIRMCTDIGIETDLYWLYTFCGAVASNWFVFTVTLTVAGTGCSNIHLPYLSFRPTVHRNTPPNATSSPNITEIMTHNFNT